MDKRPAVSARATEATTKNNTFIFILHHISINASYPMEIQGGERQTSFFFHKDLEKQSDLTKFIRNTIQCTLKPTVCVIYDIVYELCSIQ